MKAKALVPVLVLLAALVSASSLVQKSQTLSDSEKEPETTVNTELHPLWILESATSRTYLLGSIHVLRERDYPLPEVFYEAYEDAERIVMEIDLTGIEPLGSIQFTRELAMLPEGQDLESVVGPETYTQILKLGRDNKIGMKKFDHVDPWYAAMTVTQIQLQRLGYRSDKGIEIHFAELARKDNKPGSGLETLEQQLGFLDALSIETQINFLLHALSDSAELEKEGEAALAAWKNGDLESLHHLLGDSLQENPELHRALLTERNRRWLARLIKFTESDEDHLVIVGALHLSGDDGLIKLLEEAGFKLRQL